MSSEAHADDDELIDRVRRRILAKHGDLSPINELPLAEQTVLLVYTVKGIVDNGGFHYLFEAPLPGDPCYELALSAFERIGALECVLAFRRALNLFPGGRAPTNTDERLEFFNAVPEPRRQVIDELFYKRRDVWSLLARYIRAEAMA